MLYVVELEFALPAKAAQRNAWYTGHLEQLLSVPGFHSAQRFHCLTPWPAPYLAIYTVDSPDVFVSDAYRARGGRGATGQWQPLMSNWDRNLFAGIDRAPAVDAEQLLLLTEAEPEAVTDAGVAFSWAETAGLDRTLPRRGFAVVDQVHGRLIAAGHPGLIRAYRPLMPQRVPGRGSDENSGGGHAVERNP